MRASSEAGLSVTELIVTLALVAVLTSFAAFNYLDLRGDADSGAGQLAAFLKKTRAKALGTTQAYTVTHVGSSRVVANSSLRCGEAQTPDPEMVLDLPHSVTLSTVGWSICYSARGLADTSLDIRLHDAREAKIVRVALGGGLKVE